MTSWVLWMFKRWRHGTIKKLTSCVLWISWSDHMGILNIHELTSLVFWILTRWLYGNIQKLASWVFWNSYSKLHFFWIFKIPMTSLQEYSKYQCHYEYSKSSMSHIQNYTSFEYSKYPWHTSRIFKIPMSLWIFKKKNQNIHVTYSKLHFFWIFKIPMTSLQEHSKIPMTSAFEYSHDVTLWIFKIPMTSLHEYSKCLMGNLNIRMLTPWVFWKFIEWRHWSFEYSWSPHG